MKNKLNAILWICLLLIGISCDRNQNDFDASGTFEADEIIISAETQGILKLFNIEEGQELNMGYEVGYIDSLQLYLKKKQLESQIEALLGKKPNISVQLAALQKQMDAAKTEKNRIENLIKGDAAVPKQLDDINTEISVLHNKIEAQKSTLNISSSGIDKESVPLQIQIEQIEDQLQKSKITNPIEGTVLTKYAYANELMAPGKPLYKIADLSNISLKVYITGDQLADIKLNQEVEVFTDDGKGGFKHTTGQVYWISSKAEFTPKTIQTKKERADKVYAVKIRVDNSEGLYKIGMYGEINLN